jgi:hypothetical protein
MDCLRLSCDGFTVGSLRIPAFSLRAGECLCVHLSGPMDDPAVEQLIQILTGEKPMPAVRLFGRVLWAAPRRKARRGLFGLFWKGRIEPLSATAKTVLGVEAAWLAGAQVVGFTTAGLDPLGREAVYEAVSAHFPQGSAIHLSFPFLQNGQRLRGCFAGTTCIESTHSSEFPPSETIRPRR